MTDNGTYRQLWHFTCLHGRHGIGLRGEIRAPAVHPILKARIAWFTELAEPDREASGLGMHHTRCDRMTYRYRVTDSENCVGWLSSASRRLAPEWYVEDLESFGDPEHWWIALLPVPAVLDGTWRREAARA